jgi:hypothetical protein
MGATSHRRLLLLNGLRFWALFADDDAIFLPRVFWLILCSFA